MPSPEASGAARRLPAPHELVELLRSAPAWQRKRELALLTSGPLSLPDDVGDDCAAIPDGDGFLLLAAEVMWPPMVALAPELAGVNAVLANVNDVYAMGGRPIALLDTLLAPGLAEAEAVLRGVGAAARRYGIPVVGGHLTATGETMSLAAFIVGRARRLLSGRGAVPGDELLLLTAPAGRFVAEFPFWECSGDRSDEELRGDLDLLPRYAEMALCDAARDVSMPGVLGSALQFLEGSGVGATIDVDALPFPPEALGGAEVRWLLSFPSYGFLLAVDPAAVDEVRALAAERGRVCPRIGTITRGRQVVLAERGVTATLWDFDREAFAGFGLA
jgi:selenophosphate synthetase-related protein